MRVYLGALGWVNQVPQGNRLRWSVPVDAEVDGRFLGLPTSVTVERAIINASPPADSSFFDAPSGPMPLSWWNALGDLVVPPGIEARITLPSTAQALRFVYQGPETLLRVRDDTHALVAERRITHGTKVLLEQPEIAALDFLRGGGTLTQTLLLDLFAGHDANAVYEQIATLSPASSPGLSLKQASARLGHPTVLTDEDWADFHNDVVTPALSSDPNTETFEDTGTTRWQQFSGLMAVRWNLSLLYGFGFLDGPDAGPGAAVDTVTRSALLTDLPPHSHVYRVRCRFENHPEIISNPIVVRNAIAAPLQVPVGLAYEYASVRLFDEADYALDAQISLGTADLRVIGCEIEEEVGKSEILDTASTTDAALFLSWRPPDWSGRMQIKRDASLPFYDVPLRFRARSLDGWDRTSGWSHWTPPTLPKFLHSPLPPPLMDAQIVNDEVRLYPRTPSNRFTEWVPDHAALNTPGAVLEVMRRVVEPATVNVTLSNPIIEDTGPEGQMTSFRAFFSAPLPAPLRFTGGALIAGSMRATIRHIETHSVVFRPTSGGSDTAAMIGAGPAALQQSPTHPDLFTSVATTSVTDLPGVLSFSDTLAPAEGRTMTDHYAVRVDMGIVTGGLSNTATALRHPAPLDPPPPFVVEILGVDFYDRTSVRIRFSLPAAPIPYVVAWASGRPDAQAFHDLAVEGDHGPQAAMDGLELFEVLTLPVSVNLAGTITIGVQAKTEGGFVSDYRLTQVTLPLYSPS